MAFEQSNLFFAKKNIFKVLCFTLISCIIIFNTPANCLNQFNNNYQYSFLQGSNNSNLFGNSNFNTRLNTNLYHSTAAIFKNLRELANGSCKGKLIEMPFSTSTTKRTFRNENHYDINKYNGIYSIFKLSNYASSNNKNKLKVFIIAGEHARELISVELAYYFINILCSESSITNFFLDNFDFRIIPVANPLGRQLVETGNYCKRSNLNQVDPNRNWSENWEKNEITIKTDEYSGDFPFSEIESSFAKDSVSEFKPDVFLTLHSGVFGLFHPYASKLEDGEFNIDKMKQTLQGIKDKFCPYCYLGSASKFLGYVSHGNCLDYVYDILKTPYSFAWEIYTNEINYKQYLSNQIKSVDKSKIAKESALSSESDSKSSIVGNGLRHSSRRNNNNINNKLNSASSTTTPSKTYKFKEDYHEDSFSPNNAADSYYTNMFNSINSMSFLELKNTIRNSYNYANNMDDLNGEHRINSHDIYCLNLFNPNKEDEYSYMIQTWSQSMLYLFKEIYSLERPNNQ